jgi:hypothetical protein
MANSLNIQTVVDGPRNLIVKITGILNTSDVAATQVVTPATSQEYPYLLPIPLVKLDHIDYSISSPLEVILYWGIAAGPAAGIPILPLAGRGRMSFCDFGGLTNNQAGTDGSIWLATSGYTQSEDTTQAVFSVVLELVKTGMVGVGRT